MFKHFATLLQPRVINCRFIINKASPKVAEMANFKVYLLRQYAYNQKINDTIQYNTIFV